MKNLIITLICGLSSQAGAVVLFTDIPNELVFGFGRDDLFRIDLDGDNTVDFIFRSNDSPGDGFVVLPQGNNRVFTSPERPPDIGTNAIPFQSDDLIFRSILSEMIVLTEGSERFDGRPLGPLLVACALFGQNNVCLGDFAENTGFLGVEFESGGSTHYGYIEVNGANLSGGNVLSWAYETEIDTAILAGAVPEPSSLLMAFGGLTILLRRRR